MFLLFFICLQHNGVLHETNLAQQPFVTIVNKALFFQRFVLHIFKETEMGWLSMHTKQLTNRT